MAKKEERNTSLRKKLLVAGLAFLFFVLLLTSFFGQKGLLEIRRAQKRYEALLEEINELEKKKTRLEREIEELERKPGAVDREAREKLWLMKPDEIVIVKEKK
jgi:cell division protein FtsB